jgi:DNA mismatch repair protein MutL
MEEPVPEPVQRSLEETSVSETQELSAPWKRFRYLAQTERGYLLVETEEGIAAINPRAARERIAYERLLAQDDSAARQTLLIPETARLSPSDAGRIRTALPSILKTGFSIEEFGRDTFKIDAVPQIASAVNPASLLSTLAQDLAEGRTSRSREGWKEELIAKSVAKSCARMALRMDETGATRLVDELAHCRMPYLCPRGKPVIYFISNRELDRKFARD